MLLSFQMAIILRRADVRQRSFAVLLLALPWVWILLRIFLCEWPYSLRHPDRQGRQGTAQGRNGGNSPPLVRPQGDFSISRVCEVIVNREVQMTILSTPTTALQHCLLVAEEGTSMFLRMPYV